jgi:DNA-binding winged helix-turn-helix (wHTH) protein
MNPKPDDVQFRERLLAAKLKHHFQSTYFVRLVEQHPPTVQDTPLKLNPHAYVLLLILAQRAIVAPGAYATTEALILAIKKCEPFLGKLGLSWQQPTAAHVYEAVCEIRRALKKNKLKDDLLEYVRGQGYRLPTPAMSIEIDVPGAENMGRLSLRAFESERCDETKGLDRL